MGRYYCGVKQAYIRVCVCVCTRGGYLVSLSSGENSDISAKERKKEKTRNNKTNAKTGREKKKRKRKENVGNREIIF